MLYDNLKPKKIFEYFKKISSIPRGSGNEGAVADYVLNTAISLGHKAEKDEANNVLVTAKATAGYEDHEPIMLQGHLDMVCEANSSTVHDFTKDPIELVLNGDILSANGTTLGADNGVAVATMLAVLDSDTPHPILECLFTTDEEVGLGGMRKFDPSKLTARRLVNLDSAGEGEATISCAGGVRSHIYFDYGEMKTEDMAYFTVEVKGLFGGHSGEDIDKGRIGAIYALARILSSADDGSGRIAEIKGGSRDNAIPRECTVTLAVEDKSEFIQAVKAEEEKIRAELISDDFGFTITVTEVSPSPVMSREKSHRLISLLNSLPSGVFAMSRLIVGLVETSSNLAVVRKSSSGCEIILSSRSSVESRLDYMQSKISSLASLADAKCEHTDRYPGWDYIENSALQSLYLDTYRDIFSSPAKVIGIHAGLECGLLKGRIPDMDIISIGPDIRNLHSPDETLSVSSFSRFYSLVTEILKRA